MQNQNFVPRVPQQQGAPRPLQSRPPGPPSAGPQPPHQYQNSAPLPFQPRGPSPQQQSFNLNQQQNQQYHPQLPQQQFQQQRPPPPRAVGYVATRPLFRQPQPGQAGSPIPGAQQQQPLRRPPPAHFNTAGSPLQQPQSPTRGGFYQFPNSQGSQPNSPVQQFSRSMERSPLSESPVANMPASVIKTDDEDLISQNQKPAAELSQLGSDSVARSPEPNNRTPEVTVATPEPLIDISSKTPEPIAKTPEPGSKPPMKPANLSNEIPRPDSSATNGLPKSSTPRPASSKPQAGKKVVTPTGKPN